MEGEEGGGKMPVPANAAQARFAEQVNKMIRTMRCLHYSYRTEETYVGWAQRFLTFAGAKTLEGLNGAKVRSFLERLAVRDKVSASTQKAEVRRKKEEGGTGGVCAGEASEADPGGAHSGGGSARVELHARGRAVDGAIVLWERVAIDGMRSVAGSGCG